MRRSSLPVLLLALVLAAGCGRSPSAATASRPSAPASPSTSLAAVSTPPAPDCPPPEPPVMHSEPPRISVDIGVTPENPATDPGQPVPLTVFLKNEAKFPLTLDTASPVLELRPLEATPNSAPLWQFTLKGWAGVTLQPGQQVTTGVVWPGDEPGYYRLEFGRISFNVACTQGGQAVSGGGTLIQVRPPGGSVLERTLAPKKAVTVHGITVRVDAVELTREKVRVTFWVSGVRAPAGLSVGLIGDDGRAIAGGLGVSNRDAAGGGIDVEADFAPIPTGTRSLAVQVSDIDIVTPGEGVHTDPGPWRVEVPLD